MGILDDIPEGGLVALDTVIWIYTVEAHPQYGPILQPVFRDRLDAGKNRAGSCELALGELLVAPHGRKIGYRPRVPKVFRARFWFRGMGRHARSG